MATFKLLDAVTATGAGKVEVMDGQDSVTAERTFQAYGTTSNGSGSATIAVQVTNNQSSAWLTLGTITLTLGTSVTADGFASQAAWQYVRGNLTAISGTDATVTLVMGA